MAGAVDFVALEEVRSGEHGWLESLGSQGCQSVDSCVVEASADLVETRAVDRRPVEVIEDSVPFSVPFSESLEDPDPDDSEETARPWDNIVDRMLQPSRPWLQPEERCYTTDACPEDRRCTKDIASTDSSADLADAAEWSVAAMAKSESLGVVDAVDASGVDWTGREWVHLARHSEVERDIHLEDEVANEEADRVLAVAGIARTPSSRRVVSRMPEARHEVPRRIRRRYKAPSPTVEVEDDTTANPRDLSGPVSSFLPSICL
jgi:hypothetical protein